MAPRDVNEVRGGKQGMIDKIPLPMQIGAIALTCMFGVAAAYDYAADVYLDWSKCNTAEALVDILDNEKAPFTDEDKKSLLSPYCD